MTKISIIALFLWLVAIIGVVLGSFIPALAPPATYHIDLYIHFSAYGLLAGLPMFITHSLKWRSFSIVLMIAFGIGVEWVQSFVPGRSGSIDDVVVNLIGIALGTVIAGALSHRIAWHFDTVRMNEERLLARSGTITTPN